MFDVALVLGVYLLVVVIVAWAWWTRPAPEAYYLCAGLALVNFGLLVISGRWIFDERVSLAAGGAYIGFLLAQIVLLLSVGRKVHGAFVDYVRALSPEEQQRSQASALGRFGKGIVLALAGAGSLMVIGLIISRRIVFLQPGEMTNFYVMVSGMAVLVALVWARWLLAKRGGGGRRSQVGPGPEDSQ